MKILRPEPVHDLPVSTILKHAAQFVVLRKLPIASKVQRSYFRRAAAVFAYGAMVKAGASLKAQTDKDREGVVSGYIESARNCRLSADIANQAGYAQEAGALYITSARLCHKAFDWFYKLEGGTGSTVPELKLMQLYAYDGLAQIKALPEDDLEYWQDRLAEVCAAILPSIAAYQHQGKDYIDAILCLAYVAQVLKNLLPTRINTELKPMPLGIFYLGNYARLYAELAHTELLGGFEGSAIERLRALFAKEVKETDDLIYALMVGIAAARATENKEQHAQWLAKLYSIVDTARTEFRSFEGRIFSLQVIYYQFRYATEPWAIDKLHNAHDMFRISEMLKARLLLDELNGYYQQPQHPLATGMAQTATEPSTKESYQEPTDENPELKEAIDSITTRSLTSDMLKEVEKLSYWSLSGISTLADPNKRNFESYAYRKTRDQIAVIEENIQAKGGGYTGTAVPVSIPQLQSALADDELLIEFYMPRDPFKPYCRCWIFVLSKTGIESSSLYIDIPGGPQRLTHDQLLECGPLSDMAAEARSHILNKEDDRACKVLYTLFDYLIAPVIKAGHQPENYRRWIIVPHGPLHLLPFQALVDEQQRFLIERVSITMAPSASVWWSMKKAPLSNESVKLLAIGNPAYAGSFADLPDAEDEVSRIAEHLPWAESEVLTQSDANESYIKTQLPNAEIVHFATHGQLDLRNPRDGHRIVLSQTAYDDGYLHASEIRTMQLDKLRLVVLNICDGAVCRYSSGDEPLGLLSAFIKAGAGNVLGGLWELPDAASKIFMLQFYNGLNQADPAAAVQVAAKHAISKKRPLLYWAGFQLIGPAEPFFTGCCQTSSKLDRHPIDKPRS